MKWGKYPQKLRKKCIKRKDPGQRHGLAGWETIQNGGHQDLSTQQFYPQGVTEAIEALFIDIKALLQIQIVAPPPFCLYADSSPCNVIPLKKLRQFNKR